MLTRCVNCEFYLRADDLFCLNCGLSEPTIELNQSEIVVNDMDYLYAGIAAFTISVLAALIFSIASGLTLVLIFVLSFIGFMIPIRSYSKGKSRKQISARFNKYGFNEKERIVQKRLSELGKRGQNIDAVLEKIKETDSRNLQDVRIKLLAAREIVTSQFARYELQAEKIELVRLQNGVSPYLFGWHRLNEYETENGLATIENTQQQINKIRQNITSYAAIEFPEKTLPEKRNFLSQLAETEKSCEKLREALLSRQAARALQEISPIEESLKLPDERESIHAAETFNIQTTLTDFSESFDELEREYKRLKAEEEIGRKFLKN